MSYNNPTFKEDGKRRIFCAGCKRYMVDTYLGEKKERLVRCKNCDSFSKILPPEHSIVDGMKVIFFGPGAGLSTMDLTNEDADAILEVA